MISVPSKSGLVRLAVLSLVAGGGCAAEEGHVERVAVARAALLSAASCPAGYNIIQGTNANNTLIGTAGNDCILGHSGHDVIDGLGGDDFLVGGLGNDAIHGQDGNDTIHGEDGFDTLHGHAGNDVVYGGTYGDEIFCGDGDDLVYGGEHRDLVYGGQGRDRIFGEGDLDDLYGDEGDDILEGGLENDDIWGGAGHDVIQGGPDDDNLRGGDGNDAILGGTGVNIIHGGEGTDRCAGTSCELAEPVASGCTLDSHCVTPEKCVVDIGVCLPCLADADGDNSCDGVDGCPNDANKTVPGVCGCGVSDADSDADGAADCVDACAGDPAKTAPGICGCGVSDADSDADGTVDCNDACASDPTKTEPGICGCGVSDADTDADGTADCNDACASDPSKTAPGICGCGVSDADTDADGTADCNDACASDPAKTAPGICGCGVSDADSDADGNADCNDLCPGFDDTADADADGIPDGCEVACVAGASGPFIHEGDAIIATETDLEAFEDIQCITGSVQIMDSDLTHLAGLASLQAVAGNLVIIHASQLTDIDLPSLESVGGMVTIGKNDVLNTLAGLANLTSIGALGTETYLHVGDNPNLAPCWTWLIAAQTGVPCGRDLGVPFLENRCNNNDGTGSCGTLPPGFVCEPGATGPGVLDGDVLLNTYEAHDVLDEAAGAVCITGDVIIGNPDIAGLEGLEQLQAIGGDLTVSSSPMLADIELPALASIGGTLLVSDNAGLESLGGLPNLTQVGALDPDGGFAIMNNPELPQCWVAQLEAQLGVACGTLFGTPFYYACEGNDEKSSCPLAMPLDCGPESSGPLVYQGSVTAFGSWAASELAAVQGYECITGSVLILSSSLGSLSQLSSLAAVGGDFQIIDNDKLRNLDGLQQLDQIGGSLMIQGNDSLETLDGLANIDFVAVDPNAWTSFVIEDNASLPACWVDELEAQLDDVCGYDLEGEWQACDGNLGAGTCE